jgi:glycosyltransferase involved in cell wall biosynthesis
LYKKFKIGVVTAAYNEERFIEEVIRTMPDFVDRIFVVNDCSSDRTGQILANMNSKKVVAITHSQRMGAGAATLTGYKAALNEGMDVVAVMAGDGQMDPAILDKILEPVVNGSADYSKGDRLSTQENRNAMPKFRLIGNFMLTYLVRVSSGYWKVTDPMNGYTAISRETLSKIDLDKIEKGFAFEADLMVKMNLFGARLVNVPMASRYRGEKSKIIYINFMIKMTLVLAKAFLWRIWKKYLSLNGPVYNTQTVQSSHLKERYPLKDDKVVRTTRVTGNGHRSHIF